MYNIHSFPFTIVYNNINYNMILEIMVFLIFPQSKKEILMFEIDQAIAKMWTEPSQLSDDLIKDTLFNFPDYITEEFSFLNLTIPLST
ncbi:hypothetical protein EEL31_13470 [Brevibacillus laterosporus]|nr:hypothetical protein EEL31_13470 [Brevibacillus laterosporus]